MGDTILAAQHDMDRAAPRQQAGRICVDLCENIHLHYRDLRIEFSRREWSQFARFIDEAHDWLINQHPHYREAPNYFADYVRELEPSSDHHAGRLRVEKLANGIYHLHWHDLRLEMMRPELDHLAQLIAEVSGKEAVRPQPVRRVAIADLRVIVLDAYGTWHPRLIEESPNYQALVQMDRRIHDQYVALQRSHHPELTDITTTEAFLAVWRGAVRQGLDLARDPAIRIDDRNIVLDGHHRVAIAAYLHGVDYILHVHEQQVIGGGR